MPPKKAEAKGGKDTGPDPKACAAVFEKAFKAQCAAHEISPLSLDYGDGSAVFARLAAHPALLPSSSTTGMVPAHTKSLIDAVTGFTLRVDPEKLIQGYPFLQTLALWSANVRDEGAAAVGAFLATNRSLTALELSDCALGPRGCKAIADGLERNATLTRLNLDGNPGISDAGVEALSGLRYNCALASLSLCYCGLTAAGGEKLTGGLMKCAMLKTLELRGNRLGAAGVLPVLHHVQKGSGLFRLGLADTSWDAEPEVHSALLAAMEANPNTCEWDLTGARMGDANAYRLLQLSKKEPPATEPKPGEGPFVNGRASVGGRHLCELTLTEQLDPILYRQILDSCAANKKDWLKKNKKKGGKGKGKGKKKK